MAERDNTARLYEALKGEGYTDLGTLSEFEGSLKDSGKREHVYMERIRIISLGILANVLLLALAVW